MSVTAVDVYQHAAEKFHALARIYAHDRPSSRVKDLVDLVLLVEAGLLVDLTRLRDRLAVVYRSRDDSAPPADLDQPPHHWARPFTTHMTDVHCHVTDISYGFAQVRTVYLSAIFEGDTE